MPRRDLTASIRLTASSGPLVAPDRFRIWRAGPNPGDYGDLFFTERAASSVMAEYEGRGNALVMDIEHALNPSRNPSLDPARPPPTAGYLDLELVDSADGAELWGVPRWSDCGRHAPVPGEVCCGRHQIESGQRCYVSPDWQIDTETREPMRLNRVSLVAEPATWGINLLASRRASTAGGSMDPMEQMRAGYAAMKAMAASEDQKIAKACAAAVAAMDEHAGALGMKLGGEDGEPEKKEPGAASPEGAQTTNQVDPKMASGADVQKVDDTGRGPGPGPAVASKTASRPAQGAPAGITRDDVRAEIARANEESRLRGLVAERMPKGSANLVASMSLDQLRTAARELPAPVVAPASDGGANVTAGKPGAVKDAGKMTAREEFLIQRWGERLGVTVANETASRQAWDADPVGGAIEVDVFKRTEPFRTKARGVKAAA